MIESISSIDALSSLSGLSSVTQLSRLSGLKNSEETTNYTSSALFTEALEAAKSLLQATNEAEMVTSELTYDFMTGANDNIHNLLIAQEKSSILLYFTMQTRNKVLEAYQEIMRITV